MSLTLSQLLDLPVLRRARPEVIAGSDFENRPVRWVHTSEIYEISPLLKGGEVLLTTGLGLVGLGAGAIGSYVEALARQGVAALLMEVGRTFTSPPEALVSAARGHDFPLVLLHGVVPFIEVTESVYPMLIEGEVEELRELDRAATRLHEALASAVAPGELLALVAEVCGAPVGLYGQNGDLLGGEDVRGRDGLTVEFDVGRSPWSVLAVAAADHSALAGARRRAELCARMIDIRLGATFRSGKRPSANADLVRALASGEYLSSSDIAVQARGAGLVLRSGWGAVGLAVDLRLPSSLRPGLHATVEAARSVFGVSLVAEMDREFVVATTVRPAELRSRLTTFADALARELGATVGPSAVRVSAGPLVGDVAGLARSLPAALEALHLAQRPGRLPPAVERGRRRGAGTVRAGAARPAAGAGRPARLGPGAHPGRLPGGGARQDRGRPGVGDPPADAVQPARADQPPAGRPRHRGPPGAYGARPGPGQLADARLGSHRPVIPPSITGSTGRVEVASAASTAGGRAGPISVATSESAPQLTATATR
jgi:purine catabolism regulator